MHCFGIAGWSGAGKTTLIERILPLLRAQGLRVSVLKHTHHRFDIDTPGKDSFRFRSAGAAEVMLAGDARWVLMQENREESRVDDEAALAALIARMAPCDLVLVEGFKHASLPKLEVYRSALGKPRLHPEVPGILAVASDEPQGPGLPWLPLDAVECVAGWLLGRLADLPPYAPAAAPR